MFRSLTAVAVTLAAAATPCAPADFSALPDDGARRSGVAVGAYLRLPLSGTVAAPSRIRAGLRLAMTHDYRASNGAASRSLEANAVDLRLSGEPTLYLLGAPVTGPRAINFQSGGGGGISTTVLIVGGVLLAAGVGYLLLDDGDDDRTCNTVLPGPCPPV